MLGIVRLALGVRVARQAAPLCTASAPLCTASARPEPLQVEQFLCLQDNYGFLVHCPETGATAAVDTPEVAPIMSALERRGWTLTHILNTHHHDDHTGGNAELKERFGAPVIGPADEAARIPTLDVGVRGGDTVALGAHVLEVIDVGYHTAGHIAFTAPDSSLAFVGDALFVLGCGRIFEGNAEQAWASLQRLAALPPETTVYCAHEYTEANLRFALSVDGANPALLARAEGIGAARAAGRPTVPTSIAAELETNPFLRPASAALREAAGAAPDTPDVDVFAELRRMKDRF